MFFSGAEQGRVQTMFVAMAVAVAVAVRVASMVVSGAARMVVPLPAGLI